jgi:8-oxo-dGTP diphosphatase
MKVTVDIVIFTIQSEELKVLLVKRGIPPFKGQLALPGGFVHEDESLDEAAMRELREETGVSDVYLEQLYSFGEPGRDPRERIITVAYYALISADRSQLAAGTDTTEAAWWPVSKLPALAFDHRKILDYALERLRNKLEYTTVGFQLLPAKFSLTELQGFMKPFAARNWTSEISAARSSCSKFLNPYQNTVGAGKGQRSCIALRPHGSRN